MLYIICLIKLNYFVSLNILYLNNHKNGINFRSLLTRKKLIVFQNFIQFLQRHVLTFQF